MAKENLIDQWFDWEVIHQKDQKMEFTSEEIIALNKGFDMAEDLFFGMGDTNHNERTRKITIQDVQISVSKRIKFYPRLSLFKISDSKSEFPVSVLLNDNYKDYFKSRLSFILDKTNRGIYSANEQNHIILKNDIDIVAYIKFFFYSVEGRHGKFYLVDNKADIIPFLEMSLRADASKSGLERDKEEELKKLNEFFEKASVETIAIKVTEAFDFQNPTTKLRINDVYVIFKGSLFKTNVEIDRLTGHIVMTDDEELIKFYE